MALQKIDPSKTIKTVSVLDPAIDKENSDIDKFEKTHNLEYLKFLKGEHPTYFLIKNVSTTEQASIQEAHYEIELPDADEKDAKPKIKQKNQSEMMIKYFIAGCDKYEEEGKEFACHPDMFPFAVVQEIGSFVMVRTALGDDEKKLLES